MQCGWDAAPRDHYFTTISDLSSSSFNAQSVVSLSKCSRLELPNASPSTETGHRVWRPDARTGACHIWPRPRSSERCPCARPHRPMGRARRVRYGPGGKTIMPALASDTEFLLGATFMVVIAINVGWAPASADMTLGAVWMHERPRVPARGTPHAGWQNAPRPICGKPCRRLRGSAPAGGQAEDLRA